MGIFVDLQVSNLNETERNQKVGKLYLTQFITLAFYDTKKMHTQSV